MQKTVTKKIVALLAVVAIAIPIAAAAFSGCGPVETPDEIAANYQNLAESGEFEVASGDKGDAAVFSFGKEITFNTLVMREKGSEITQFSLYKDGESEPFYSSDLIEDYRVCSFEPITASKISIKVDACDRGWKLDSLEAYMIDRQARDDFRIMGYITVDSLCAPVLDADEGLEDGSYGDQDGGIDESYTEVFEQVTQFNMIAGVYFKGDGSIVYKDISNRDGDGKADFRYALDKLRGMAPDAEIVVTLLGNKNDISADGYDNTIDRHNAAMGDNAAKLTESILAFIDEWGVDGVSFDYEYPSSAKAIAFTANISYRCAPRSTKNMTVTSC